MLVPTLALAAFAACSQAAPALTPRDVTTASERLNLKWLGNNTTLPKIL